MNKRIWTVAAPVAALAMLVGGVAAATAAPPSTSAQTIRLVGHFTDAQLVDADHQGPGPGDYVVFRETLLDPGTRARVGVANNRCDYNFDAVVCTRTFTLSGKGQLVASGAAPTREAVLGGSGQFAAASGELRITPGDPDNQYAFRLA